MRDILSRASRDVLRRFVRSRVLLAFDYDGTLAPIVSDPDAAAMRASTRALFTRVASRFPCVVISGRARADLVVRLRRVPAVEVIGNHGIEPSQPRRRTRRIVQRWRATLERELGHLPGVTIEDKGYTITVHYRQSRDKRRARVAIRRAVSALNGVRLIPGKQVVNVLPDDAPHKGRALERAHTRHGCDKAVYVGDDDTDEDVFALNRPGRLLTIRVGRKAGSAAAYVLRNQADIDELLRVLLGGPPVRRPHRASASRK